MMKGQRLLIVGAHCADWVWRSSGTAAKYLANGAEVHVVCLTYGARGESGPMWKKPGATKESVKQARYDEVSAAAKLLGVTSFEMWDFDDCMLQITPEILQKLNEKIREVRPNLIITHDHKDNTNPDHGTCSEIVDRAAVMATQVGIESNGLAPVRSMPIYGFESSEPERAGFIPDVYLDITDFFETKLQAMACVPSQKEGPNIHTRLNTHRGWQAARTAGRKDIKYAEAFSRRSLMVVDELPVRWVEDAAAPDKM